MAETFHEFVVHRHRKGTRLPADPQVSGIAPADTSIPQRSTGERWHPHRWIEARRSTSSDYATALLSARQRTGQLSGRLRSRTNISMFMSGLPLGLLRPGQPDILCRLVDVVSRDVTHPWIDAASG